MPSANDPRVLAVLTHADECRAAARSGEKPPLPENLRDLSGINLSYAILTGARLSGANLTGANLTSANLHGADFSNANLRGADLNGVDLTGAKLNGAQLGFADLTDAKITQSQLNSVGYRDVAKDGYPKEVAEEVILPYEPEPDKFKRKAKKRLVVELRSDGKLHIKTPIFKY
jgi:hypothetical protein